ncbi:MAG: Ig-like domain-containing protein [Candidatus Pristimantibacillus sp.]
MSRIQWLRKAVGYSLITTLIYSSFILPVSAQQLTSSEQIETPQPVIASTNDIETDYNKERRINFNDDWRFQRETSGSISGVQSPGFDDQSWRELNLPHDWSIELDFNYNSPATHEGGYLDGGIGWYRKTFTVPESMTGKSISIDFDGVYMNSSTYLNGQLLGTYPYGYNAFSYDISDKLYTDGRENVIAVKVNNTTPSSRWYSGSGIYRNVYLTVTDPVHVARYGTFVTTPDLASAYAAGRADVNIKTKVNNDASSSAEIRVKSTIYDADGNEVSTVLSDPATAAAGATASFNDNTVIANPTLWSIENPYRYKAVTDVIVGGETVDTYETPFGVRYFNFDNNEGFSLNGQYMKLHGVSMHHDLGALGAAVNARAVERQMQIMKDMGVNAIRVTHNPASPELLEAANNLGLLVIEEAFDAWNQTKKTYDYARFFSVWSDRFSSTWAEHDVKEMVDRGKNEPSIIMWSLGNEIYDASSAGGAATARSLNQWIKEVDTTRPTTIGQNSIAGNTLNSNIKAVMDVVDIVGFNYAENNYTRFHEQNPNWKIYGSETSSATRSRGVYTHPYQNNKMTTYSDYQQSSYDNDSVSWGRTAEDAWKWDRDLKHIAGQFIWTGFDYIGEPTPYYSSLPKSSYFGAVDTAGFPKDIFYYYQSQWGKESMVHLLPHWNWKTGETVRVLAYTNAYKVELFLNGISQGERSYVNKSTSFGVPYKETSAGKTYLEWAVPFQAGTLEAVAKDEAGNVIARDKVVTAGVPAAVKLTADRAVITADGKDLSFITVDVVDSEGNIVPTADNLVHFSLSGNGELVGVDNGNAASIERFKDNKRKAFSGKALAIIESSKEAGEIIINATASGLQGNSIKVITVPAADNDQTKVVGFELVHVTTRINEAPVMPAKVGVYYSDSTIESKAVSWDAINPSSYAKVGKFTVEGSVEGVEEKIIATITVKSIVAVKSIAVATKVGTLPILPAQVSLLYSDESTKEVPIAWDTVTPNQVAEAGNFVVEGSVTETTIRAKAAVRVTNETQRVNIMTRQAGSSYPQLEATFTSAGDSLNHILDGIKSYNESPKNRWTNWSSPNAGDSITVNFGEAYAIDNLNLFVFTDFGTAVPGTVKVQYWDGTAWKDVQNVIAPSPYVVQRNEIRFDAVTTDRLKFHMTSSESGKYSALTEVEVYADRFAKGATAALSGITINGEPLAEFNSAKLSYELSLPRDSNIPEIAAVAADHAAVTILPAQSIPGTVKLFVTSEDGLVSTEYVIALQSEAAEKVIKSTVPVTVVVDKGVAPTLPKKVVARYDDDSSADVEVVWNAIDPALYSQFGEFTILGSIEGTDIKASAKVIVKGAIAVEHTSKAVLPKQLPDLPPMLTVYFNDGTEEQKAVNWDTIPAGKLNTVGTFELGGSVEGVELRAKASIRVTDEVGTEHNISLTKNGYDYPKAEASFTNNGPASLDKIEAINDGIISYGDSPQNRWTNWQRTPRAGDWVSITFGDYGPVEYDVDNTEIHWFGDSGTSYPASFKIQYKSGDSWVDVTNLRSDPTTPTVGQANRYTFDRVRTSAIRVDMTARSGLSLAITEINIYNKSAAAGSEPIVNDIQLDGSSIMDQFVLSNGSYEATVKIRSLDELPQITASGGENTSITIIPVSVVPATAKVIARSEDGKKSMRYNINYQLEDEGTPKKLAVSLTGPTEVQSEESFTVNLGLHDITLPVQAQDIIVRYDSNKFQFIQAASKLEHVQIIETVSAVPGQVHLLVVSTGEANAIRTDGAIIELTWKAKAADVMISGSIETTQAITSDASGAETNAELDSIVIAITPILMPGNPDVNGDGKVSIGDLSIAAAHYGKTKESSDWEQIKRADVNGDGAIGIEDLAAIARKIME